MLWNWSSKSMQILYLFIIVAGECNNLVSFVLMSQTSIKVTFIYNSFFQFCKRKFSAIWLFCVRTILSTCLIYHRIFFQHKTPIRNMWRWLKLIIHTFFKFMHLWMNSEMPLIQQTQVVNIFCFDTYTFLLFFVFISGPVQ